MRLLSFRAEGRDRVGLWVDEHVLDLGWDGDMATWLAAGDEALSAARRLLDDAGLGLERLARQGRALSVQEVTFRPVVPRPAKILCLGLNYRHHAIEMGWALP